MAADTPVFSGLARGKVNKGEARGKVSKMERKLVKKLVIKLARGKFNKMERKLGIGGESKK